MLPAKWSSIVVIILCLFCHFRLNSASASSDGVCYTTSLQTYSYIKYRQASYQSSYSCGFLWISRCRRTRYWAESYVAYGYQYVSEFGCCEGYHVSDDNNQTCSGVKIGFQTTYNWVYENAGSVSVCVSVLEPDGATAIPNTVYRVRLTSSNGSALSGSDFTALDTTLSIYSNSRTKCASIPINYDYVPENYEEFTVSLSAGAGLPSYVTLSPASATVRIYNRHRVNIGFEEDLYHLEDDACTVHVCVSAQQPQDLTHLPTSDHFDLELSYPGSSEGLVSVILTPPQQHKCVSLEVVRARLPMQAVINETSMPYYVELGRATATIAARQGVVIGFEETEMTVHEDVGSVPVCVKILQPSLLEDLLDVKDYLVNVLARNTGSANDFMALNTTLTFNKNTGRLCTSLNIIHDHIHEMEEEYEVVLFNDELPYYVRLNPNTLNIRVKNVERNVTIGFDVEEMAVPENTGDITVCVTATVAIQGTVKLMLNVLDISTYDITFKTSPLLQFDADHTSHCVELSVVDDSIGEGSEAVIVTADIVSMTHPFYVVVEPAFLKVTVLDNDAAVIGFDSTEIEVTKRPFPQSVPVCLNIAEEPARAYDTYLIVNTHSGLADNDYYLPVVHQFLSIAPDTTQACTNILIKPISPADRPTRTFTVSVSLFWNDPLIFLEPKSVLIRLTNADDEVSCTPGPSDCLYQCSDPQDWTDWVTSSSVKMRVAKDICLSEETVVKTRQKTNTECTETGQFCAASEQEKLVQSFNLGVSRPSLFPLSPAGAEVQDDGLNNSCSPQVISSSNAVMNPTECEDARPQVCANHSILFVLDSSSHVGEFNFNLVTSAVGELSKHMCGDSKVAVMKFNSQVSLERCFECDSENRFNLREFINNNVTYESNGESAVNDTLPYISEVFSEECGDHSSTDCIDIVFVLDAQSLPSGVCVDEMSSLKRLLPLQDSICNKSRVFAVGIGSDMDTVGLKCLADSVKGEDTIFTFDSYLEFKTAVDKSVEYMYVNKKFCGAQKGTCDVSRVDTAC